MPGEALGYGQVSFQDFALRDPCWNFWVFPFCFQGSHLRAEFSHESKPRRATAVKRSAAQEVEALMHAARELFVIDPAFRAPQSLELRGSKTGSSGCRSPGTNSKGPEGFANLEARKSLPGDLKVPKLSTGLGLSSPR